MWTMNDEKIISGLALNVRSTAITEFTVPFLRLALWKGATRSQAVARIADRTASQQALVISDALPMKLHAVNSTDKFPVTLSQHYSH